MVLSSESGSGACGACRPVDGGGFEDAAWANLVPDVLMHVFSYLPVKERFRVGSVCKSWRQASLDPSIWKAATLGIMIYKRKSEHKKVLTDVLARSRGALITLSIEFCRHSILKSIGKSCVNLEHLTISRGKMKKGFVQSAEVLLRGCPQLRSLDLCLDYRLSLDLSDFIQMLGKTHPHLVSLFLESRSPSDGRVDDLNVQVLVDNLPNLETLGLRRSSITHASLHLIGEKMRRLRTLHVDYCKHIHLDGVRSLRAKREDLHVSSEGVLENHALDYHGMNYYDEDIYDTYDPYR